MQKVVGSLRSLKGQIWLLLLLTLISFIIFYATDMAERFFEFSRHHESWELDDLVFSLGSALLINSLIFAALHWLEVQRQTLTANTDPLTGIMNRRGFEQQLEQAIVLAKRRQEPLALLILDLDNFKLINDLHGHLVGDATLVLVATAIRSQLVESHQLARWGGDKFVVLAEQTTLAEAQKIGSNLQQMVMARQWGATTTLGITFGIAKLAASDTSKTLLYRADQDLYAAKHKRAKLSVGDMRLSVTSDSSASNSGSLPSI